MQFLFSFLEDEELEPVVPETIPTVLLNYPDVLDKALANNSFAHNIRRHNGMFKGKRSHTI